MREPGVIRAKDRDAVLRALRAGTVPRIGVQHLQVGRDRELRALVGDLDVVADGGATFRTIVAPWGAGKTFLAHVTRTVALTKNLCTMHADLGPDRRLSGSNGEARALWRTLLAGLATRSRPDGGALAGIVERFITTTNDDAHSRGIAVDEAIRARLGVLAELGPGGYAFRDVIGAYRQGYEHGDDALQADALRWLRGEFETRSDARQALGVRALLGDSDVFDALRLLAGFTRLAGYAGLVVFLDEFVHIQRLSNAQARDRNYDALLGIVNGITQGFASHLGIVVAATPETLDHPRRGMCSNRALATRLAANNFTRDGLVDHAGPVISLAPLGPEELFVLVTNIRRIYTTDAALDVPDDALHAFLTRCATRLGDAAFRTPRDTVRAFVQFLDVLAQNPGVAWPELLNRVDVEREPELDTLAIEESDPPVPVGPVPSDDALVDFTL